MLVKNAANRNMVEIVSLEEMVPKEHLLRKIDAAIDFTKIYEFVEGLYSEANGRPSVDPVVLFNTNHRLKVGDTHATRAGAATHRPVSLKNQFQYDLSDFNWFFV